MSKNSRSRLWARWLSRKPAADLPTTSLRFEQLEDRTTPTTFTWTGASTGAGANANWSNPGNWTNDQGVNQAPTGAVIDLVFPAGAQRLSNIDDLTSGTVINSISVQGSGYTFSADPANDTLVLGNGTPSSGTFTVNTGVGATTYGIATTLATNGNQSVFVGSGSTLKMTAPLSASLQNNLNKDGVGRLDLAAANPNLLGGVKVNSGILEINNVLALGPVGGTETTVATNAGLYLNNVATVAGGQQTIGEQVRLNGGGFDPAKGALYAEAGNAVWSGPVILGAGITSPPQAGGPGVVFGAAATYRLDISGVISDTGAGMGLVKEDAGEVRLSSPTGNTYRGQTNINNGVLTITNALSLGDSRPTTVGSLNGRSAGDPDARPLPGNTNSDPNSTAFQNPTAGTVINQSSGRRGQLKLEAPVDPVTGAGGFTVVGEYLVLNSNGNDGNGAIYNAQGDNTWAGSVVLGSPSPDGASPTIGVAPRVVASPGPPAVAPVSSSLAISGVVSDPNSNPFAPYSLTKVGGGRLILSNANTYTGRTFLTAGTITIRDSQGLGPAGGTGDTVVSTGATLELDVEAAYPTAVIPEYDDLGRDTWKDSVTNDAQSLRVNETLSISGRGVGASGNGVVIGSQSAPGTGRGALRNMSGINHWIAPISLGSGEASIGVLPDGDLLSDGVTPNLGVNNVQLNRAGHPTPDSSYFTVDYSLTVDGTISGARGTDFVKRGTGHLILPNANPYLGRTLIEEGWVTVENNRSLGAYDSAYGKTAQQPTIVSNGAALHVRPPVAGVQLDLKEEQIVLEGIGPTHPYTLISQKGALVNIGGTNVVSGDIGLIDSTRQLTPTTTITEGAGVGVEDIDPAGLGASDLTLTGELSDGYTYQTSHSNADAGLFTAAGQTRTYTYTAKATQGRIIVPYNMGTIGDRIQIYSGSTASTPIFDSGGLMPNRGLATVNFSGSNQLIVVVTSGGGPPPITENQWSVGMTSVAATPRGIVIITPGSLVKLGSKTLSIQGAGSQTGPKNEVREGTLRVQNDTALGRATLGTETSQQSYTVTGTEVKDAATLELAGSVAMNEGGVAAGVQVNDEKLSLNQYGLQLHIAGQPTARFRVNFAGQVSRQIPALSGYTAAYGYDPVNLPYDQYLAQVFNQDLSNIAANLVFGVQPPASPPTIVVTQVGTGVYSVTFGEARFNNFDFSALTVQVEPVGTQFVLPDGSTVGNPPQTVAALAEVRLSGSNAPLVNLSDDNAWRGPVALNHGTRIEVRPNSRLSLLGNVTDNPATNPTPSDLVKRDAGDLTLGGLTSDYRGVTYVDEGIVTAVSSRAFGDVTGGTVVGNGAQLQLQGSLTIAGESLQVQGNGTPTLPSLDQTIRWLNVAPGATNNGVDAPYTGTGAPTSAQVTSVATDPTDPNVIYVATAGGGAWKTKDGGLTWIALFDLGLTDGTNNPLDQPTPPTPVTPATPLTLLPVSAMMFGGQIAVAPSNPAVVYYATGNPNGGFNGLPNVGQLDNYAGSGVYRSTDAGKTWTRLVNGDGSNPLYGQAVTKMIVDPFVADRVFVASSTLMTLASAVGSGVRTSVNIQNAPTAYVPVAGVWRYEVPPLTITKTSPSPTSTPADPGGWFNLTGTASANRTAGPGTAGPEDYFSIRFPDGQAGTSDAATWSDLALVVRSTSNHPEYGSVFPYPGTFTDEIGPGYILYAALGESNQRFSTGSTAATEGVFNAVFRTENPDINPALSNGTGPVWWLGKGTIEPLVGNGSPEDATWSDPDKQRGGGFADLIGPITPPGDNTLPGLNGYIKLAAFVTQEEKGPYLITTSANTPIDNQNRITSLQMSWPLGADHAHVAVYAAVMERDPDQNRTRTTALRGGLRTIYVADGVLNEAEATYATMANIPTDPFGTPIVGGGPTNIRPGTGRYDFTLAVDDPDPRTNGEGNAKELVLGGLDFVFRTTDAGATAWQSLAPDDHGFQPGEQFHALSWDTSDRLLIGSDAGLWRWDRYRFSDLNSGLTITELNSADPHPTDFRQAVAGSSDNGTQQWNGNTANGSTGPWARIDDASTTPNVGQSGSVSGVVRYDPQNPSVIYAVRDGILRKSSDGGQTWVQLNPAKAEFGTTGFTAGNNNPFPLTPIPAGYLGYNQFPMVVDPLTPNRVLVGGLTWNPFVPTTVNRLYESTDGGNSWTNLNSGGLGITPTVIALAGYQGTFAADPRFPTVTAGLSNTPDPRTIYVSDGATIKVTKNRGNSWMSAALPVALTADETITSMVVNPVNRDEIYVTVSAPPGDGVGRIWRSLKAGQAGSWTNITGTFDPDANVGNPNGTNPDQGPLPAIPTYTVAVDPRSGNLYVGNDNGVWQLVDPGATDPANIAASAQIGTLYWRRFGDGMPNVSVRDLVLNQNSSTLTAATYGRGMFQMFLPDYAANSGAVRAVSGTSRWTGTVVLTGNTRIGAAGTQQIQNGLSAASIDFGGTISSPGGAYTLEKVGRGTVILSGSNTYTGQTLVTEGVVEVKDPHALGAATAAGNTVVQYGAALQVRSDIEGEPITINGDGIYFNGHPTGALRNVSGNNVYDGVLTLGTGSYLAPPQPTERDLNQVTIGVDDGSSLRIGYNNTAGVVGHVQGVTDRILTVSFGGTLAGVDWGQITATGTAAGPLTGITRQNGSSTTGAGEVQQFAVPRAAGTVTFTSPDVGTVGSYDPTDPNFPAQFQADLLAKYKALLSPGGQAAATVVVAESAVGFDKELAGTLVLSSANTAYLGTTQVVAGAVEVRDGQALGPAGNPNNQGTVVFDGAAVRIANNAPNTPTVVQDESLTLSGTGTPDGPNGAGTGALRNTGGNNTWAGPIRLVSLPNYAPTTNPGTQVAFGVSDAADVLTVTAAGGITEDATVGQFGLIKVGPGVMRLEQANLYTGVTNVNEGTLRAANDGALGSVADASEVQTIRVFGTGTYQLNLNGQLTAGLTASPLTGSGAAAVAYELERLIAGDAAVPGATLQPNVQVTETPNSDGRVFTVTFRGSNGTASRYYGQNVPVLLAANPSSGVAVSISTPQEGGQGTVVASGASLELDGTGLTVAETLTINGPGVTQGGVNSGALGNRDTTGGAGTNTYSGTVTFGSATALGAQPGTTLTVTGRVLGQPNDPGLVPDPFTAAAAELTKVGTGMVVFPDDKEYRGRTVVSEGALQIQSANSLGIGRNEVQRVRITGTFGDQFTLTFLGETTTALTFAASDAAGANALQTALENLASIGAGNVVVAPVAVPARVTGANGDGTDEAIFDVTFIGQLANTNLPLITETSPSTPVSPAPITLPTATTTQGTPRNGNGTGGANEVQTITVPFQAGQFSLFSADAGIGAITPTTGLSATFDALDPNLLAAVQAALDAKYGKTGTTSNAAATIATQAGNNGRVITVTFTGATWGYRNVAQITGQFIPTAAVRTQTLQDGTGGLVPGTSSYIGEAQLVPVQGTTGGQFKLQYTNPVTGQVITTTVLLDYGTSAAVFQKAMTDPIASGGLGIGVGNVRVTRAAAGQSGYQYLVQFEGALGNVNLLPVKVVPVAGGSIVAATATTLSDGPEGTTVLNGASLQVKNLPLMTSETVTLNGDGQNGAGALDMVHGATLTTTTWSAPLILGSTAAIGVDDAADTLRLTLATTDRSPYSAATSTTGPTGVRGPNQGFGVNKVGAGTAEYAATGDNDYTGTTTVRDGTLLLNHSLPALPATQTRNAILGNLVVGDGVGAAKSAVLREAQNNQVADTSPVTVNGPDGLFDLNGKSDAVAQLTVLGGTVDTNASGTNGTLGVAGAIVVGDRSSMTAGGTIQVEKGGSLTGTSTTMTGGQINIGVGTPAGAATANLGPVDMALGAQITAVNVATAPGSTVNTTAITAVGGSTITIGDNDLLNAAGAIDLTGSSLVLGNSATAKTNGNTLTARSGSSVTTGSNATLTTVSGATRGAVTLADSSLAAGNNSQTLTGALSLTNSTLTTGNGASTVLNTGGRDITLTNSSLSTGTGGVQVNPTAPYGNLSATGPASTGGPAAVEVNLGAGTVAHFGTVNLTTADLSADTGSQVTTGDITLQTGATLATVGATTLAGGNLTATGAASPSSVSTGDGSTTTLGAVNLTGGSLTTGTDAAFTSTSLTGTGAAFAFGASGAGTATASVGVANLTGGSLTTGDGSHFTSTSLTGGGATIGFGPNSVNTTGDLATTTGQVSFGQNSQSMIGALSATTATVSLDTAATATTTAVNLTAGHVALATGATLSDSGPVTVNLAATPSDVTGAGTFVLSGSSAQTVSVADGAADQDFVISSQLGVPDNTFTQSLVKAGAGRMVLAPAGAGFPNPVVVQDGDVEVDTVTAAVQLDKQGTTNPSLSGTGATGPISGATAGTAAVGVVSPGVNYAANPAGILTADGDVTFGAATTFRVNIAGNGISGTNPTAGTNYDQLYVNGNVALGDGTASTRPTLDGLLDITGVKLGHQFTIVQTAPGYSITGSFVDSATAPGFVFIDGYKFKISYTTSAAGDAVVLEKVKVATATTLTSSDSFSGTSGSPSTLKQPVTFTASVTAEAGSRVPPAGTTFVRFFVDGVAHGPDVAIGANGQAVATFTDLTAGTHTVTAEYLGDADNFNVSFSTPPLTQVVQDPAVGSLVGSPAAISPNNALAGSPGVNDLATFTAQVTQEQSAYGYTLTVKNAGGQVVYQKRTPAAAGTYLPATYPGTTSGITVTWDGTTTAGAYVADGNYTAQIGIDDQWGNVRTTGTVPVVVDNTRPTAAGTAGNPVILPFSPDPTPPATTTFSGTVGDTNLTGWTVTVADAASNVVKVFSGAGTGVTATWDGTNGSNVQVPDGTYTLTLVATDAAGNQSLPITKTVYVLTQAPTVTLYSGLGDPVGQPAGTVNTTTYGDNITVTAVVTLPASVAGATSLLDGKPVAFDFPYPGGTAHLTGNLAFNATRNDYEASVVFDTATGTLLHLGAGTYTGVTATFQPTHDFLQAAATGTHTVVPATLHVAADPKTRAYGDPNPALTYTVTTADLKYDDTAGVVTGTPATAATQASNAGKYDITQGTVSALPNYTVVFTNGAQALTVTQVPLTITVNDATRARFAVDPAFTATYQGFKNGDGPGVVNNLQLVTTATKNSPVGTYPIQQAAGVTPTATNYFPITVIPGTLTVTGLPTATVVGAGGSPGQAVVLDGSGNPVTTIPFSGSFAGGIRTASADFNQDGVADYVIGTGPGTQAFVQVIDGATGATLFQAFPFEDFTGGVFVAAGDMDGDGKAELVVTPDEGGGPRVVAYHGGDFAPLVSYFAIDDPNFRGGVRASLGDLNGDGYADLAVSAGFGGGPRISLWDGKALSKLQFTRLTADFFAFEDTLRNGAFVAIGDVNGDGVGDLITGAGPGGGPRVKIWSGASLLSVGAGNTTPFADFFAGNVENRGGVKVAAKNLDADKFIDVVTGGGAGDRAVATAYKGADLAADKTTVLYETDIDGTLNGVFVG